MCNLFSHHLHHHFLFFQIKGRDLDEGDAGKLVYTIYHVSNNGKDKFRIDPQSGELEAVGKLYAGEQYRYYYNQHNIFFVFWLILWKDMKDTRAK